MNSDYCSSDSEVEWEEVEDVFSPTTSESTVHTPSLEITVNIDGSATKKKKTKNFLEKALDKFNKELKENLHKCNLLCLLAHGQRLNKQCNQTLVQAQLLSLLPHEIVADKYDKANIKQILDWFVLNHSMLLEFSVGLEMSSVQLAVALYRSVGITTRLVLNLAPLPFKTLPASKKSSTSNDSRNLNASKKAGPSKKGKEPQSNRKRSSSKRKSVDEPDLKRQKSPYFNHTKQEDINVVTDVPDLKRQKSPYFNHTKQKAVKNVPIDTFSSDDDNGNDLDYKPPQTRSGTLGKRFHSLNKKKPVINSSPHLSDNIKLETSVNSPDTLDKKVDVSMSFHEGKSGYTASSSWIEVRVSGTWMTVHFPSHSVGSIKEAEEYSNDPLVYVVGIDGCGKLKDLTAKYAFEWCTKNRKWRIPGSWWSDTLRPYLVDDEEEDEEIRGLLLERPMPANVAGFKDHPLYVLKRHLLKFEAIYPEESQVLGYCHREPIYARECVHTLHTRETWLKQGRIVKQGEEAYMSVKARPKRGQKADEDRKVDVFGHWQTQVYTPPPVVDGKIQRNEYGNVELFQPSMLPKGACHIQLSGIHRIAKLLDIDCAPAMMGWDFSSGYCHPVIDGVVTAEENRPVLVAAWEQRQNENQKKQQEKKEKKIYERWRLLIRGVLLKERVQKRFETTE